MLSNILLVILGMIIMAILVSYQDIKRSIRDYKIKKRYARLSKGVPSHVVGLRDFDDIWFARKNPFYINGEVYTCNYRWFPCNAEFVHVKNKFGERFVLESQIVSSVRTARNRWKHRRAIYMKTNHDNQTTFKGRFVNVDSVLEVY